MKRLYFVILLMGICLIFGCKNSDGSKNEKKLNLSTVAEKVCDCRKDLLPLNKKIEAVQKNPETSSNRDFIQLLEEIENAGEKSEDCVDEYYESIGLDFNEEQQRDILKEIRKKCPEVQNLMDKIPE